MGTMPCADQAAKTNTDSGVANLDVDVYLAERFAFAVLSLLPLGDPTLPSTGLQPRVPAGAQ